MESDRGRFSREDFEAARPQRPGPPQAARGSIIGIVLAGGFGLMLMAVLLFLAAPLAPVVLAAGGFVFFLAAMAAFHYVVWGWWLGGVIGDEVAAEDKAEADAERDRKLLERSPDDRGTGF